MDFLSTYSLYYAFALSVLRRRSCILSSWLCRVRLHSQTQPFLGKHKMVKVRMFRHGYNIGIHIEYLDSMGCYPFHLDKWRLWIQEVVDKCLLSVIPSSYESSVISSSLWTKTIKFHFFQKESNSGNSRSRGGRKGRGTSAWGRKGG